MDSGDEAAQLADAAAAAGAHPHRIARAIRGDEQERTSDRWRISEAFEYLVREPEDGHPFEPASVSADGSQSFPVPVADQSEQTMELWAATAARATHPAVRARLHHLLFLARHGRPIDHATAAIGAHLEMGDDNGCSRLERAQSLVAAHDLALRVKRSDDAAAAERQMLDLANESLSSDQNEPGVTHRLIRCLASAPAPPDTLDEVLARDRDRYPGGFNAEEIIEIQITRSTDDPHRLDELRREAVRIWLDEADRAEPLVAIHHLEKAAAAADRHGVIDLRDEAVRRLQAIDPETLGLQTHRVEIELDPDKMERYLNQFVAGVDWRGALDRLIAAGSPTGDVDENRRRTQELAQQFPLQALFPVTVLGGDGLPRWRPATDEEAGAHRLTQLETLQAVVMGQYRGRVLVDIGHRLGPISVEELAEHLTADPHVPPELAAAIARCFDRYWNEDYEGAVAVGVPKIEALVRNLLRGADEALYRRIRAGTPGQYPGLGALLDRLPERGFDESWRRFLLSIFASASGENYRNEWSHGLLLHVDGLHATHTLIALYYLARLRFAPRDDRERPTRAAPSDAHT